jgi:hypothetical protein
MGAFEGSEAFRVVVCVPREEDDTTDAVRARRVVGALAPPGDPRRPLRSERPIGRSGGPTRETACDRRR